MILVLLLLPVTGAATKSIEGIKSAEDKSSSQTIVDKKIALYNKQYPDVFFIQLAGGNELTESLQTLKVFLGHEPTRLANGISPEPRQELLYDSFRTIIKTLEKNASSSTMFKVGLNSFAEKAYMCVITLSPEAIESDKATLNQDLIQDNSGQGVGASDLNHNDYLRFVIDREAHLCLNSLSRRNKCALTQLILNLKAY